ncbi:MAG: ABC transporter ATP-binding protein [Planctomycetota bacterium]
MPEALKITNLRFTHRKSAGSAFTLEIADLAVAQGEQVLLRGKSGSGKSTLLHLIAGLIEPEAGRIEVAGRDIHRLKGAQRDGFRGQHIGMVFQTHQLLGGFTAAENVMAALAFSDVPKAEHDQRAAELLTRLGIDRHGATPEELSIGQQQRVAVARALACGPELVLADEPTASLDPENAADAVKLMQEVCNERGAAFVCVSHDPTLVEVFKRSIDLADLVPANA